MSQVPPDTELFRAPPDPMAWVIKWVGALAAVVIFFFGGVISGWFSSEETKKYRDFPRDCLEALQGAERLEVMSLRPAEPSDGQNADYHRGVILGSTAISDPAKRQELIAAFQSGVEEFDWKVQFHCFYPHHGIRAVSNGKTTDFIICFQCTYVYVFEGKQKIAEFPTSGKSSPIFNAILKEANLPLPK